MENKGKAKIAAVADPEYRDLYQGFCEACRSYGYTLDMIFDPVEGKRKQVRVECPFGCEGGEG